MTLALIICAILGVAIVAVLVTHLGWSIATQHRDHEVIATGGVSRRWIWSRPRPRRHARPADAKAIPSESIAGHAGLTEDQG